MSQSFDSGVTEYVKAQATITVFFPVDKNGQAYICCAQCFHYNAMKNRCGINGSICEMNPKQYVASGCPLEKVGDDQ